MDLSRTQAVNAGCLIFQTSESPQTHSNYYRRAHRSTQMNEPLTVSEQQTCRILRLFKKVPLAKHVSHMDFKMNLKGGKEMDWVSLLGHTPTARFKMSHFSCLEPHWFIFKMRTPVDIKPASQESNNIIKVMVLPGLMEILLPENLTPSTDILQSW